MKTLSKIALISLISILFSACNTVEGAGKDIKAGGEAIENTANDAKN